MNVARQALVSWAAHTPIWSTLRTVHLRTLSRSRSLILIVRDLDVVENPDGANVVVFLLIPVNTNGQVSVLTGSGSEMTDGLRVAMASDAQGKTSSDLTSLMTEPVTAIANAWQVILNLICCNSSIHHPILQALRDAISSHRHWMIRPMVTPSGWTRPPKFSAMTVQAAQRATVTESGTDRLPL